MIFRCDRRRTNQIGLVADERHDVARTGVFDDLVQAGKTAFVGGGWPLEAWVVIAVWTLALSILSVRVYQRDTKRI